MSFITLRMSLFFILIYWVLLYHQVNGTLELGGTAPKQKEDELYLFGVMNIRRYPKRSSKQWMQWMMEIRRYLQSLVVEIR